MSEIHIGTQGWNYDDWVGPFYPWTRAQRITLTCTQRRSTRSRLIRLFNAVLSALTIFYTLITAALLPLTAGFYSERVTTRSDGDDDRVGGSDFRPVGVDARASGAVGLAADHLRHRGGNGGDDCGLRIQRPYRIPDPFIG